MLIKINEENKKRISKVRVKGHRLDKWDYFFNARLNFILKQNPIIVCIGTPKVIGDSFGPLFGSKLSAIGNYTVYGTMENPIHALNLDDKMEAIKELHPNRKILAFDAALARKPEHLLGVTIKSEPIFPGAGVGKELQPVGDYSISACGVYCAQEEQDDVFVLIDKLKQCKFEVIEYIVDNLIKYF